MRYKRLNTNTYNTKAGDISYLIKGKVMTGIKSSGRSLAIMFEGNEYYSFSLDSYESKNYYFKSIKGLDSMIGEEIGVFEQLNIGQREGGEIVDKEGFRIVSSKNNKNNVFIQVAQYSELEYSYITSSFDREYDMVEIYEDGCIKEFLSPEC